MTKLIAVLISVVTTVVIGYVHAIISRFVAPVLIVVNKLITSSFCNAEIIIIRISEVRDSGDGGIEIYMPIIMETSSGSDDQEEFTIVFPVGWIGKVKHVRTTNR